MPLPEGTGMHFRREDGTVMMGVGKRSTWAAYRIVLITMAIQGLTPDYSSLASPWLLRIVASPSVHGLAASDDASPLPRHDSDDGGVPGAMCQSEAVVSAPRVRLDDDRWLRILFLATSLRDRPIRSATRSLSSQCLVQPRSYGPIPPLCHFLC
jgi:hypothetical protein